MSIGRTLKKLLGGIAPTLATAVGGPFGGVAMKFLADKFGLADTGEVEDFLLGANPEVLAKLKLADKGFDVEMRKLDVNLEEIAYQDRASARDLAKVRGIAPQALMSGIYTVGYFGVLYAFMSGNMEVGEAYQSMFNGLLGVLSAAQIQVVNFWFGSSAGSKAKTDAMAAAPNGAQV